jgi:hypothetical protein
MLIEFKDANGSPIHINPQYVIAVREEKHFGRPGVGSDNEYRDTLILTTKGDFNVRDALADVAREINRVSREILELKPNDTPGSDVRLEGTNLA